MLVICSNCKARLQLDESKIPPHSFKLRCPKCQGRIEIKSAVPGDNDSSGITFPEEMTPTATQASPFERPPVAPAFKPNGSDTVAETATVNSDDIVKFLAQVLRHADSGAPKSGAIKRPAWNRRKALVCVEAELSGEIASGLVASDYE